VIAYRLLTGQLPYTATSLNELLARYDVDRFTPIADLNPNIPQSVCQTVERAISSDALHRYENAWSFASALQSNGRTRHVRLPKRDFYALSGIALFLFIVGYAVRHPNHNPTSQELLRQSIKQVNKNMAALTSEARNGRTSVAELTARAQTIVASIEDIKNVARTTNIQISELKGQVGELKSAMSRLEDIHNEMARVRNEIHTLNTRVGDLEQQVNSGRSVAQNTLDTPSKQLEDARTQLADVRQYERSLDKAEKEVETLPVSVGGE
jgi:prefoldin subunit 5